MNTPTEQEIDNSLPTPYGLIESRLSPGMAKQVRKVRWWVKKFAIELKEVDLSESTDQEVDNFLKRNVRDFILFLADGCNTKTTYNLYKSILKSHFGIDGRHFNGVTNNKVGKLPYELSIMRGKDLIKIIQSLDNSRDRALLAFIFGTGGRRAGEARLVRFADVQVVENGSFSFILTHTKSTEMVFVQLPVDNFLYRYFAEYWKENKRDQKTGKPLFPSDYHGTKGNFLSSGGIIDLVSKLIGVPSHALRRGFVLDEHEAGKSLEEIALKTKHKDTGKITYSYLRHATERDLAEQHAKAAQKNLEEESYENA